MSDCTGAYTAYDDWWSYVCPLLNWRLCAGIVHMIVWSTCHGVWVLVYCCSESIVHKLTPRNAGIGLALRCCGVAGPGLGGGSTLYHIEVSERCYDLQWSVERGFADFKNLKNQVGTLCSYCVHSNSLHSRLAQWHAFIRCGQVVTETCVECKFPMDVWINGDSVKLVELRRQGLGEWLAELVLEEEVRRPGDETARRRPRSVRKAVESFLSAESHLAAGEKARQERHAMQRHKREWVGIARLAPVGSDGGTELHRLAVSGKAALIRARLAEWAGDHDWLDGLAPASHPAAQAAAWQQRVGYRTRVAELEAADLSLETLSLVELIQEDLRTPVYLTFLCPLNFAVALTRDSD